jgi:hypothetical protein
MNEVGVLFKLFLFEIDCHNEVWVYLCVYDDNHLPLVTSYCTAEAILSID